MGKIYNHNGSLYELYWEYVCVKDIYGKTHRGQVIDVGRADENDSGEDSIGIITRPKDGEGVGFDRHEIVSIEILEGEEITEDIKDI